MAKLADRIEASPRILHGKPHIKRTRIPVDIVLGLLGDGLTPEEITREHYPQLTKEDILACIRYAKEMIEEEEVYTVEVR
jgi:uncharacterized protein (DUF433 family)